MELCLKMEEDMGPKRHKTALEKMNKCWKNGKDSVQMLWKSKTEGEKSHEVKILKIQRTHSGS